MLIKNKLEKQGNWLFKRRGQLPILLLLLGIIVLSENKQQIFKGKMLYWQIICFAISCLGLITRCYIVGYTPENTSGRNTSKQIADELNTNGMYSILRHPLYLGNFIAWLGLALYINSWWLVLIFVLVFWIYYERIMYAEEAFLLDKFGESYLIWASATPTFFPHFSNWKPNIQPFSFKKVLRQEYSGLIALVISFVVLDVLDNFFRTGSWQANLYWLSILASMLILVLILRTLKKSGKLNVIIY